MKRPLSLILSISLLLLLCPAAFGEASSIARPVLTIGDVDVRSSARVDGEKQVGLWRYLEDQLGVEIQFEHIGTVLNGI